MRQRVLVKELADEALRAARCTLNPTSLAKEPHYAPDTAGF